MNDPNQSKRALRIAIGCEWLAALAAIGVLVAGLPLPAELQTYLDQAEAAEAGAEEIRVLLAILMVVALHLLASVGLFLMRPWGRILYTITNLFGVALMLFAGPTVEHAAVTCLGELTLLASGFAMGISYFGGIPELREKRADPGPSASM